MSAPTQSPSLSVTFCVTEETGNVADMTKSDGKWRRLCRSWRDGTDTLKTSSQL